MESLTRSGIITLTTDFGLDDAYVGIVKAVLLSIFPGAALVDITHNIAPQNLEEASYILYTSVKYFPTATVHLAVVDPGVGSSRRPILVQSRGQFLVGPDNGVFTDFLDDAAKVFFLNRPQFFLSHVSHTFHARDVFAPVAAHLARGTEPEQMGELISDPARLERLKPVCEPDRIVGSVIYIDRFGNMITNIKANQVDDDSVVRVMGKEIQGVSSSYSEKPKGTLLAVIGSSGLLEIALASDSAALRLKGSIGQAVEVRKPA
jgi:S-adenosyl-L-methionine hydrolase (adenosine-forming)